MSQRGEGGGFHFDHQWIDVSIVSADQVVISYSIANLVSWSVFNSLGGEMGGLEI